MMAEVGNQNYVVITDQVTATDCWAATKSRLLFTVIEVSIDNHH